MVAALRQVGLARKQAEAAVEAIYDVADTAVVRASTSFLLARGIVETIPELADVLGGILQSANASVQIVQFNLARKVS